MPTPRRPVRRQLDGDQVVFQPGRVKPRVVVGVWGIVGLVIGVRFFSWEPRV